MCVHLPVVHAQDFAAEQELDLVHEVVDVPMDSRSNHQAKVVQDGGRDEDQHGPLHFDQDNVAVVLMHDLCDCETM